MTVIAFDGQTLASDKRAVTGKCKVASIKKIHKLRDGSYAAISGTTFAGMILIDWINRGAKIDDYPIEDDVDVSIIVVTPQGVLYQYDGPIALKLDTPFYAIGSGREYALAAMYLGCDARQAVEVANALDQGCGNGVDSVTLPTEGTVQ